MVFEFFEIFIKFLNLTIYHAFSITYFQSKYVKGFSFIFLAILLENLIPSMININNWRPISPIFQCPYSILKSLMLNFVWFWK